MSFVKQSKAIDGHFDLTYDLLKRRERGERNVMRDVYLPGFRAGGFAGCVSSVFVDDRYIPDMGLRRALEQIAALHEENDENPGLFRICKSVADLDAAEKAGEFGVLLSLEGADPIGKNLNYLRIFYELGVRALGLVWARRSLVGDGYALNDDSGEEYLGGLSHFGIECVARAEALGMVVDVSHLTDKGFEDLVGVATKPFIASHSNCRHIASHKRNLTDAQIRIVAESGGVVGMNGRRAFVCDDQKCACLPTFLDHIDHVKKIGGIDAISLGFDFCDNFKREGSFFSSLDTSDLFGSHSELPFLVEGLIGRGYSEKECTKILSGNLRRVYQEVC